MRVDIFRISSERLDCISHGSKINNRRNTSEVLQDHSAWSERNLHAGTRSLSLRPVEDLFHVRLVNLEVVTVPDSRLQENPDGESKFLVLFSTKSCNVVKGMVGS